MTGANVPVVPVILYPDNINLNEKETHLTYCIINSY
ncbi:hypothetical protein FHS10_000165 [Mucilaginibacter dorajii]|nr:hypothetical protein [Mucilaginibacter dorajii]